MTATAYTFTPAVTLDYTDWPKFFYEGGDSAYAAGSLVGSDPWDASTSTYSHTETVGALHQHWGLAVGAIPTNVLDAVTAYGLVSVSVAITAEYTDDDVAAGLNPYLLVVMYPPGGTEVLLVRDPDTDAAFLLDARDMTETHTADQWLTGSLVPASTGELTAALLSGQIKVSTPADFYSYPVEFSTYATVYTLSMTVTVDVPAITGTPPRRIFGRHDGATHGAKRVLGNDY